jgi:hypothetical protein
LTEGFETVVRRIAFDETCIIAEVKKFVHCRGIAIVDKLV